MAGKGRKFLRVGCRERISLHPIPAVPGIDGERDEGPTRRSSKTPSATAPLSRPLPKSPDILDSRDLDLRMCETESGAQR